MKRIMLAMICGLAIAAPVSALQPQAIQKNGACPSGYSSSGNYCTPRSGAGFAIGKNGACPSGYSSSGNYCVARSGAGHAIHKNGSCPSGYSSSGKYCVQR